MKKHHIKKLLFFSSIVLILILLVLFIKTKALSVDLMPIEPTVDIQIYGLGTVEAKVLSQIGFEVGAEITELNADQGDIIKTGDVLAQLRSTEQETKTALAAASLEAEKSKLQKAKANIPKLQATLNFYEISSQRSKTLLPDGAVAEKEAQQDQMDKDIAAAELEMARNDISLATAEVNKAQHQYEYEKTILSQHTLRAPYDALVVERHKELGSVVLPGESVFTLVDPKTVWVLGYVDEARAGFISVGQPAQVKLRSMPHKKFSGKVTRVDIESDRISEERRVYVSCLECPKNFHLGEQAEVYVHTATLNSPIMVPETAIEEYDGTQGYIWTVQQNKLRRVAVKFGHKTLEGLLEITSRVDDETKVLSSLPNGLYEGRRAKIKKSATR